MDIAGVSMEMANISLQTKVGAAVLSKAMDTNEALGHGLVQMIDAAAMEQSVNPNVGGNFDLRVQSKMVEELPGFQIRTAFFVTFSENDL